MRLLALAQPLGQPAENPRGAAGHEVTFHLGLGGEMRHTAEQHRQVAEGVLERNARLDTEDLEAGGLAPWCLNWRPNCRTEASPYAGVSYCAVGAILHTAQGRLP